MKHLKRAGFITAWVVILGGICAGVLFFINAGGSNAIYAMTDQPGMTGSASPGNVPKDGEFYKISAGFITAAILLMFFTVCFTVVPVAEPITHER